MSDQDETKNNNENEDKIYVVNDNQPIYNAADHDFDIMPEEFFNAKYQQSRVRKEQELQKEKDLIDKKKREKEEKLKKLAELDRITKEKDELKKERERVRLEEKRKKQEEIDLINKKKKEERDRMIAEQQKIVNEKREMLQRQQEKKKKLRELDQKAKEERRSLKKQQKEILKNELEKKAALLKAQNNGVSDDGTKNREVKKMLSSERAEILRKIKLEQKLNQKEQRRIRKEVKEEEKKKIEAAQKELEAKMKLEMGSQEIKKKNFFNLGFIKDDRLDEVSDKQRKKRRIIVEVSVFAFLCVVFAIFVKTGILDFGQSSNVVDNGFIDQEDDFSIRLGDKASFEKDFQISENNLISYSANFKDRRDIESINFDVVESSSVGIDTGINFGVFTFGKVQNLNQSVSVKVANINCDGGVYLSYFDDVQNIWNSTGKVDCADSVSNFVLDTKLFKYYMLSNNSDVASFNDSISDFINLDPVMNYGYNYKFSRFIDFYKYHINDGNSHSYLSTIEKVLYKTDVGADDSDGDGYLDGEEVMNLYDPAFKNNGQSLNLKMYDSDSGKVKYYQFGNVGFYYPSEFLAPFEQNNSIVVAPESDSQEYFSFTILNNETGVDFNEFLEQQEQSKFYDIKNFFDTINSNFYVDDSGSDVYLDIGNGKVLRISYNFITKESVNYAITYLMMLKGIVVK